MDVVTPAGSLVEGCARLPQQQRQRGTVDRLVKTWEARERFQLGAEQQCTACEAVVERSFSHAVSGQGERAVAAVPHPEGEHAYSDFERLRHAPSLDGLQQDLGIRMPAPANVAFRLQRRAHRCMVVDLAVERDGETPARGMHGLMSGGRKIEDGEAAMRAVQARRCQSRCRRHHAGRRRRDRRPGPLEEIRRRIDLRVREPVTAGAQDPAIRQQEGRRVVHAGNSRAAGERRPVFGRRVPKLCRIHVTAGIIEAGRAVPPVTSTLPSGNSESIPMLDESEGRAYF